MKSPNKKCRNCKKKFWTPYPDISQFCCTKCQDEFKKIKRSMKEVKVKNESK